MRTNPESERFETGAGKYAAYLETPEGHLRLELAFANLLDFIPKGAPSLRALDVGCGPGANALRLARLGIHVTLLDSSPAMLDMAERAAHQEGVTDKIELKHGDASQITDLFCGELFDVILCHNLLEYVADPAVVLDGAARVLRDESSIVSVLVRNRAGEVLKAALKDGDLVAADSNLTTEQGREPLYGGAVRLFTAESLQNLLQAVSLARIAERGVRIVSDYLPPKVSRTAEYGRIFELERKLGSRPEFAAIARYTHCLAHRANPTTEDEA